MNYQFPNEDKEEFEVVLVGVSFLVLKNKDANNLMIETSYSRLYKTGDKIYKENGEYIWRTTQTK